MRKLLSSINRNYQTVIPRVVRKTLDLKPGDRLAYVITDRGIVIKNAAAKVQDDTFAAFAEWASAADDESYADL